MNWSWIREPQPMQGLAESPTKGNRKKEKRKEKKTHTF
jgi:hypothetical protein